MIKASGIIKDFGSFRALNGMNMNIPGGSVYGLVGPNGAGKTTFIKILMGIIKADAGTVEIDGSTDFTSEKIKQRIIYVSDDLFFYPTYTIKDTAKFYADIYDSWDKEMYEKLKSVFNISENRKVRKLSKGMQKQVAFWLGICARPDIMVLDEPVDGLDPVMRRNIMSLVLEEVEERGMTVLVSSHNLRELEDICDYVGIMHGGQVVIEKSLDDVKGNVHKLQVAFGGELPSGFEEEMELLHKEEFGSVRTYIVKGGEEEILAKAKRYNPLICDILPLSLEEVFIYELGGMGYELKNEII